MPNFNHIRPYVANDNSPATRTPRGDAVGFNAMLRERQNKKLNSENSGIENKDSGFGNLGFILSGLIWLAFAAGTAWTYYTSQPTGARIFAGIGLIWSGLWTRFLALDHLKPRLAELCLLSTLIGFMSLLVTATIQMGYPLSLPGGLIMFIAAALVVSAINRSITALVCAIAGSLFWAALQIDGYVESGLYALAIPAILALIILQALRLKSAISLLAVTSIGLIWLAGTAFTAFNNGQISLLLLASGAVLVGNAFYRAAKAADDERIPYTQWQVAMGWIIANTGLLTLAKYGIDPTDLVWQNMNETAPTIRLAWLGIIGLSLVIYFVASVVRRRHKHMSLAGVCLTTILLASLPFCIWNLEFISAYFTNVTNMPLYPNIGLFLFGIVSGNITFFIFNAFRRFHYGKVIIALLAIAILAYVATGIDLLYQENWVVWLTGIFTSLLVALVAVEPQLAPQNNGLRTSVSSS